MTHRLVYESHRAEGSDPAAEAAERIGKALEELKKSHPDIHYVTTLLTRAGSDCRNLKLIGPAD